MNTRIIIASIALGTCSLFAGIGTASAYLIGGSAAQADAPTEECASHSYNTLKNTCDTTKHFHVPLVTDGTTNSVALSFRGRTATTEDALECRGQSMNSGHTGYWATGWGSVSTPNSVEEVDLGSLNTNGVGSSYLRCKVGAGAELISTTWSQ